MTNEEKEIALYCLKATSGYHSEVCEECVKYPICDHTMQDDVIETIIKALEQQPKTGAWVPIDAEPHDIYECNACGWLLYYEDRTDYKYCPNCGAKMIEPQESEDKDNE